MNVDFELRESGVGSVNAFVEEQTFPKGDDHSAEDGQETGQSNSSTLFVGTSFRPANRPTSRSRSYNEASGWVQLLI